MPELVEDFLRHYGKMGMKWGKRKGGVSSAKGKSPKQISTDASEAKEAISKLKKHGTSSLSNKELQSVISRMNLEQQLSKLSPSAKSRGNKATKKIIGKFGDKALERVANMGVDAAFKSVGLGK